MSGLLNKRFTQVPNFLLDEKLSKMDGNTVKVLMVIIRKTFGFHKIADQIALSQIAAHAGISKNTAIKGLNSLIDKEVIKKDGHAVTNRYSLVLSDKLKAIIDQSRLSTLQHEEDSSKSSNIEQGDVQKLNCKPVQKLNTQKKPLKKNIRNTTSSNFISIDVEKVANKWVELFNTPVTKQDQHLIIEALKQFTVQELCKAMFNRSLSDYYRFEKPYLRNNPKSFFSYPATITNDLLREPDNLFTYDEKVDRVTSRQNKDEDFEIVEDIRDGKGRAKWILK